LLAARVSRLGWLSFSSATVAFLVVGIVVAFAGAMLRTWGAAYLGVSVVKAGTLEGDGVVAAGPYRWFRNPLYVGTFLNMLALALLMPPSGAVFTIVTVALFQLRLIAAEEAFLVERFDGPYLEYCAMVPRLLPLGAPKVAASAARPEWLMALAGEVYMWGVALSFALLGWRYNSQLLMQCVIVSLGVSIMVRAFLPKK
jgi:protein-S-isoprenylcysteine O-methyltransferase Ste14